MKIKDGIKTLLAVLTIISFLSTDAIAETNISTTVINTDTTWKTFDVKVKGWTSINFDDSYWIDAKVVQYGISGAPGIYNPESNPPTYFRKTFELSGTEIMNGKLYSACPIATNVYINDKFVNLGNDIDITPYLIIGRNVIAVEIQKDAYGNYWCSLSARIRVVSAPASSPSPALTSTSTITPTTSLPSTVSEGGAGAPSGQLSKSASVNLYGEKTEVVLGEDILLKLSAVNLITKPKMHVQVIIIPPSGMSVTSSEFSKSAAGQFTANYQLEPGDGKDIEVRIRSNQVGEFNVNGRIIYYFGDEKDKAEDQTLNLPIKVRKEIAPTAQNPTAIPAQKSTPGFGVIISISGLLFITLLRKRHDGGA